MNEPQTHRPQWEGNCGALCHIAGRLPSGVWGRSVQRGGEGRGTYLEPGPQPMGKPSCVWETTSCAWV